MDFKGPKTYNTERKGRMVVFTNTEFNLSPRSDVKLHHLHSSERDGLMMLDKLWNDDMIPKAIQPHGDFTVGEMKTAIDELSNDTSLVDVDLLVLVFLTYGDHGLIYGKDGPVALQNLLEPLKAHKCLNLAGKPKLIILQTTVPPPPKMEADNGPEPVITIPSEADFLYLWSRLPADGFVANPEENGSLFISTLIDKIKEHKDDDVLRVMTRTIATIEVKLNETPQGREWLQQEKSELPFLINQLTATLYLKNHVQDPL